MPKCRLCQQILNNLTNIYNNRLKSLTQIILKLKGFKDSWDINNDLALCENCLKGVENVALFWQNIPEAKPEAADILEKLEETSTNSLIKVEHNLPAITLVSQEHNEYEPTTSSVKKLEPIKLRIKLPRKRKTKEQCNSTNTSIEVEPLQKRTRRCPQRYDEFQLTTTEDPATVIGDNSSLAALEACNEVSFNRLPHVALLRLKNGENIGTLAEIESKGVACKIRILCQICYQIFKFEKAFRKHLKIHFAGDIKQSDEIWRSYSFHCKLCDKSFAEHRTVRNHYKFTHSEERPFKCLHCDANFKYRINLNYHLFNKHESKKRFECAFCKKNFYSRNELKIHVRTHTKERPYKCEFCPFAFAHKSNLKTHQRVTHFKNSTNPTILTDFDKSNQSTIPRKQFIPPEILLEQENEFLGDLNDSALKHAVDFKESVISNEQPEKLLEQEKVSERHLHEDCLIIEQSISDKQLRPPEKLWQENDEYQCKINATNITECNILTTFESFVENLREESIQNNVTETMISTENFAQAKVGSESVLTNSRDTQNLNVSAISKNSKGFLQLQPKLSIFQLDNSLLKLLPSTSLLGLKKWPKSFQSPSNNQLQLVKSSTFFNKEKINKMDYKACDSSNFITNYQPLQNTESLNKISSQFANNSTVQENCVSKPNKATSNKLEQKPIKDVSNEIKTSEIYSNKSAVKVSPEIKASQSWKEIKISTRPIKIKNIFNSNQKPNESNSRITTQALNKSSTNTTKNPINTGLSGSQLKPFTRNCVTTSQSLLKPVLKNSQATAPLSVTKPATNQQTVLHNKPIITKIEIMPPFQFLTTLQNPSAAANIIKPPNEYKFQCPYCYKYFKQKSPLTKHLRTHTGEKPYKCNLCPKSYADASNYKKHKILHKNAAEALNIRRTPTNYAVQSSPAYSAVSDPDPDGIEVMQTLKKFESSSTESDNEVDAIDDNASISSADLESQMWHDALDQALNNDKLRENLRRNFMGFNNEILPKSMQ